MNTMDPDGWKAFLDRLIEEPDFDVIGVKEKGSRFVFAPLDRASELRLDYDVTILPPKKELLPPNEDLLLFDISKPFDVLAAHDERKKVLVGVHPYDLIAINMMDEIYLGAHVDDNYEVRRRNTTIIASDIINIPPKAFCGSLGTHTVEKGYDLLVTQLDDRYVVEVGTPVGAELLERYAETRESSRYDIERVESLRAELPSRYERSPHVDKYKWSEVLEENYEHPLWEENARKCLTCGTCTLVCPTCVCYDVHDEVELDLERGKRTRTWDGCLLKEFTMVGSGEIFRETPTNRYRHRYYRKGMYLPMRYGFVACVGCGRCATQCLADIADPLEVMNVLAASSMEDKKKLPIPEVKVHGVKQQLLVPKAAEIVYKERMTDIDTLYKIRLDSGEALGHRPGEFIELSIFGIGEAPISIASSPGTGPEFELLVRKIGDVTSKLDTLALGDKVGIRGPFGNGFNIEGLKGRNLLYIGGGCGLAPLRSLINYSLENRSEFKKITLLYGCKDPSSLLFTNDLESWGGADDVDFRVTVDECWSDDSWEGNVGVITTLIPDVDIDPDTTMAIVVGPPVMYKYVIRELKQKGIPDENIIVSLERRMKCGVGKCGHCQINGVYVCLEGPVFNYADIKELPEAF